MHDSSEESAPTEDRVLLEKLRAQWRSKYLSDGVDMSAEELCGERTDLAKLLKLHIVFERASIGELIPGGLRTKTQLSITERLPPEQQGGQGELFFAQDIDLQRVVVVKRIRPEAAKDKTLLRKFQRGAKINAQLDHPNIVPVLSSGTDPSDSPFVVMRRISGCNLHDVIKAFHQQFSPPNYRSSDFFTLLRLFNAVCQAVDYAHSRRALHLDITTTNIIVGSHGEVYLIDWGSSRRSFSAPHQRSLDETDLPPIVTFDTPEGVEEPSVNPPFMSPEQALRSTLTEATDIYQLGAVFYVILTGQLPFDRVSPHSPKFAEFRHHVARGLKRPIDHQLRVPAPLLSILDKAMHIESGKRFNTPRELNTAIERWMADENVACHRYSWRESLHRYRRRRPVLWNTLLATTGILILATCFVNLQLYRHNRALANSNVELAKNKRELETALDKFESERAAKNELKNQVDRLVKVMGELDASWLATVDQTSPRMQALKIQEARLRSSCALLREPQQTIEGEVDEETLRQLLTWIDIKSQFVREYQKLFQFSNADTLAVETLDEIRQKLSTNQQLADQLVAQIELERASNFLEQGLLSEAWSEIQKASQKFAELRDTLSPLLRETIDCRRQQILGYYYSEFGNPWLSLKYQLQARNLAQNLAQVNRDSHSIIRLAKNCRLVGVRYLSVYEFSDLNRHPAFLENARAEANAAIAVLDSAADSIRESPEWWECRFYAYSLLGNLLEHLEKPIESKEAKLSASEAINKWKSQQPDAFWPIIEDFQSQLESLMARAQTSEDSKISESLESLQVSLLEARERFPEFWILQLDTMDWVKSLLLMNRLKNPGEPIPRVPLIAAQEKLDKLADAMMRKSQAGVRSSSMHHLMLAVAKSQDNIAQFSREEKASTRHLTLQEYLRRQHIEHMEETEIDASSHVVVGKMWEDWGVELFLRADHKAGLAAIKEAQTEYSLANSLEPNKSTWMAALAQSMQYASGFEDIISTLQPDATQDMAESANRYAQTLTLWEKCCDLTNGPLRAKFAQEFDDLAGRILIDIHREERSAKEQSPRPFANQFGSSLLFNYRRVAVRDKFMAEWQAANSPWELAKANGIITTQSTIQTSPFAEESTLAALERQALLTLIDSYDHWGELYQEILPRHRHIQVSRKDFTADEQSWLKRVALASLNKSGPKWLRSSRWQKVSLDHTRSASATTQLPNYAHQTWHADNDWLEMRYGRMLQSAMERKILPEWLALVDKEFQSAATIKKTKESNSTWVEYALTRQLLDECSSQLELTSQFVDSLAVMPQEQLAKLHPSTVNFLATLAGLRGDQELAKKLAPAFDQETLSLIQASIAITTLFNHQNESGRWFVSRWADTAPFWHNFLAEFEHRLGNKSAVQKSIEILRAQYTDASQLIGAELRMKFDDVRDQADWQESLRLKEANAAPDDINILLIKQYATAWNNPTKANIEDFERLTKNPQILFLYWVHELLGELYQKSGDLTMAREYYARALDDFPETHSSTDREYARISAKLEAAFR